MLPQQISAPLHVDGWEQLLYRTSSTIEIVSVEVQKGRLLDQSGAGGAYFDTTEMNGDTCTAYIPENKQCGHDCCPSTVSLCCACADLRPVLQGDLYPRYVDGEGWVNDETRDAGYCPICNPKNYEAWEKRIAVEKERKEALKKKLVEKEEEDLRVKELDRSRAAESVNEDVVEFVYSNGDKYVGEMKDGLPHGKGAMYYAEGEVYDGDWCTGKHHGSGDKNWCDGITYSGEWKDDMMHGKGHYVMADGTEVIGTFAQDEFVE